LRAEGAAGATAGPMAEAEKLFDSFLVVGLTPAPSGPPSPPTDSDPAATAVSTDAISSILYRFPSAFESINLRSICEFCFPDLASFRSRKAGKKWKIKQESFSFVLTDTKGCKVSLAPSLCGAAPPPPVA